jgi:hypothetical protein
MPLGSDVIPASLLTHYYLVFGTSFWSRTIWHVAQSLQSEAKLALRAKWIDSLGSGCSLGQLQHARHGQGEKKVHDVQKL